MEKDFTFKQQVRAVGDHQRLVHIMVGDEDTDILVFEPPYNILYLLHGDRIDTGKRLVQHHELRLDCQTPCNLGTPSLTSAQTVAKVFAHVRQVELFDQALQLLLLVFLAEFGQLQHRADIVFHGHFAEHTRLLWQIADTHLRTFVHRVRGDVLIVQIDLTVIGGYQTGGHIESCGLTGTVRSQQTHNLPLFQLNGHIVHYGPFPVFLYQMFRP